MNKPDFILITPNSDDDFERYYQFRWEQLRKPLNLQLGSERDPIDAYAFHCAALMKNGSIIGIGSIQPAEKNTMRIRYMAVESQYQRFGIGSKIVKKLLAYAIENKASKCWLHARSHAVTFYLKQGFKIIAEVQTELPMPHIRMETSLRK